MIDNFTCKINKLEDKVMKIKCENCSHKSVCGIKGELESYALSIKEIPSPNKDCSWVTVEINCTYYQQEIASPKLLNNSLYCGLTQESKLR